MRIFVTTKPGAKEDRIEKVDETHFRIWVTAAPEKGKANEAVIKTLARYLGVARSDIRLVAGETSRRKVLEVKEMLEARK